MKAAALSTDGRRDVVIIRHINYDGDVRVQDSSEIQRCLRSGPDTDVHRCDRALLNDIHHGHLP